MRASVQLLALAALVAAAACQDPTVADGALRCSAGGKCPAPLRCHTDDRCYRVPPEVSPADAGPDLGASPADAARRDGGPDVGADGAPPGGDMGRGDPRDVGGQVGGDVGVGGDGGRDVGGDVGREAGREAGGERPCPQAPAGCIAAGKVCRMDSLVTCAVDANGCLVEERVVACSGGCMGDFPSAACCPDAPAGCTGAGTVCAGGQLQTCARDARRCVTASASACGAGKSCTGTFPNAQCTCNSTCNFTGKRCSADKSAVETCQTSAATGCGDLSATACPAAQDQYCSEAACVPFVVVGAATPLDDYLLLPRNRKVGIRLVLSQRFAVRKLGIISATAASELPATLYLYGEKAGAATPAPDLTAPLHMQAMALNYGANEVAPSAPVTVGPGAVWLLVDHQASSALGGFAIRSEKSGLLISWWYEDAVTNMPRPNLYLRGVPQ